MKRRMFFGLALIVCGESFSLLDAFVIMLLSVRDAFISSCTVRIFNHHSLPVLMGEVEG